MIDPATRSFLDATPWPRDKNDGMEAALERAIAALMARNMMADLIAAKSLMAIIDQQGCEHLDCGPGDSDRLVDAIDVIVFG